MLHRYVIVHQEDGSDCGAAALATIALHYRRPIRLFELRDLVGTDRGGTSLLAMMQGAEMLGFSAKGARGSYESLSRVPLPAVAHLRDDKGAGHFVVIHRVRKDSVVVADPARGIESLSRDAFCRVWTNNLLLVVLGQGEPCTTAGAAPVSPWWRFLRLLAPHSSVLAEGFVCAILMTVLGISTSYFIQHLVDSVLVHNERRLLNALGIGMVLIILFRTVFGVLREYLVAHVGRKVDLALVAGYTRHLQGLPLQFFETRQVGEVLSRINDAYKVREAVSGATLTTVVDGTLVSVLLAVLWACDARLALVATAFLPVLVVSVAAHHPAARLRSRRTMDDAERLFAHLAENVSGAETFKAFGAERARSEGGESRLVVLARSLFSLKKLGISMNTLGKFVTTLAGTVILWYGGHRVMDGALTTGELIFFYTLLVCLLEPLERLTSVNLQLQEALVAVDRLYQVMEMEAEQLGGERKVAFRGVHDAIELRGVGFRYGSRGAVLGGLDLRIPAGRTVAIVGESGSGKSTLLKLLMGFYRPTEGRITIDGINMQDFGLASLRGGIGLVSQDPFIFTGTVHENIALGRPGATREQVIAAAQDAGLDEFIAGLPQRYETVIGERGSNLSGGQRQRLAIARALLRQPHVLIFDEATSHLDTATESAIQKNLRQALAGRTVVLVAHRMSTIREADLIYVLHRGRVAEQGTHRQLMARGGLYRALAQSQNDAADGHARPLFAEAVGNGALNHA